MRGEEVGVKKLAGATWLLLRGGVLWTPEGQQEDCVLRSREGYKSKIKNIIN